MAIISDRMDLTHLRSQNTKVEVDSHSDSIFFKANNKSYKMKSKDK